MKKIYSFFMALCLSVLMLNAKTVETTLWEGECTGEIELNAATVATFKAGDILRIYVAASEDGGNFKLVYKGEANEWKETAIPSVNNTWPWINGGEDRFEVTFTAADIEAIASMNIYIANGGRSIVKVSLISEDHGGTTAIDNTNANAKATKIIRNGQVVILRDNKEYSIFGYEL